MKTTLILSSLLLFAALMGCSDSLNLNDPFNHENDQNLSRTNKTAEAIWKLNELSVFSDAGASEENRASYSNDPADMDSEYRVSFDIETNADRFANGYLASVDISSDGEIIYHAAEFPETAGDVSSHVELKLDNSSFTDLVFQIALSRISDQTGPALTEGEGADIGAFLKLKNITVYRLQ